MSVWSSLLDKVFRCAHYIGMHDKWKFQGTIQHGAEPHAEYGYVFKHVCGADTRVLKGWVTLTALACPECRVKDTRKALHYLPRELRREFRPSGFAYAVKLGRLKPSRLNPALPREYRERLENEYVGRVRRRLTGEFR